MKVYIVEDDDGDVIGVFKTEEKALAAGEAEIKRIARRSVWDEEEIQDIIDSFRSNDYDFLRTKEGELFD